MMNAKKILAETAVREIAAAYPFAATAFESINLPVPENDCTLAEWLVATPEARFREFGMTRRRFASNFISMIQSLSEMSEKVRPVVQSLTIYGGRGKNGEPEHVELTFYPGDTVCLAGPTGAGKSRLLSDIESLAQRDTVSGRSVVLKGAGCDRFQGSSLIAQLSQSMNFVTDLSVEEFLALHAESVGREDPAPLVRRVLEAANSLVGEPFAPEASLTQLSGGQSRALMIADIALISTAPVILIDEIENAGIDKSLAIELLRQNGKILFISTHDPVLALSCAKRLVIRGGMIVKVLEQSEKDRRNAAALASVDELLRQVRERIRSGEELPDLTCDEMGRPKYGSNERL